MFSGIPGIFLRLKRRDGGGADWIAIKRLACQVRAVTQVTTIVVYSTQIQMNQEVVWETGISA
jgi:hypothetical protein